MWEHDRTIFRLQQTCVQKREGSEDGVEIVSNRGQGDAQNVYKEGKSEHSLLKLLDQREIVVPPTDSTSVYSRVPRLLTSLSILPPTMVAPPPNYVFSLFAFIGFVMCCIPFPWHLQGK